MLDLAAELHIMQIDLWLDDDRLDRMADLFNATTGTTRERLAAAIASELSDDLQLPHPPVVVPKDLSQMTVPELTALADQLGTLPANRAKGDLVRAVKSAVHDRSRAADAIAKRDGHRRRPR